MRYLRLFINFFSFSVIQQTEHRIDFLMSLIQSFGWLVVGVVTINVMFIQTDSIAGWSKNEMLVMYSIFRVVSELWWFFFSLNLRALTEYVREGTLDYILLKPIPTQFIISFRNILIFSLPTLVLSIMLVIYFIYHAGIKIDGSKILIASLLIINSLVMIYSLMLMIATLSFWTTKLQAFWEVYGIFMEGARYPISLYKQPLNFIFTFIIPLALMFSLPTQFIVGRESWASVSIAFLSGIVFLLISHKFFYYGIKRYNSASS